MRIPHHRQMRFPVFVSTSLFVTILVGCSETEDPVETPTDPGTGQIEYTEPERQTPDQQDAVANEADSENDLSGKRGATKEQPTKPDAKLRSDQNRVFTLEEITSGVFLEPGDSFETRRGGRVQIVKIKENTLVLKRKYVGPAPILDMGYVSIGNGEILEIKHLDTDRQRFHGTLDETATSPFWPFDF